MLLFVDGFDHYATADFPLKYPSAITTFGSSTITVNAAGGRNSTAGAKYTYGGNNSLLYLRRSASPADNTVIAGFAFNATSLSSSNSNRNGIFTVWDGSTAQCSLRIDTGGNLTVMRGTAQGTVLATSVVSIGLSTWYYIEVKFVISATVGTYEVRVNGSSVLSGTGANTAASGAAQWTAHSLFFNNAVDLPDTGPWYVDDHYVCDGSGSVNNDFLGPIRVSTVLPTGDGNYSDFTPLSGANYQNVDEASQDGDTSYNTGSVAAQKDTYTYPAITLSGAVLGVQTNLIVRSNGGGAETIRPMFRISSTDYPGTTVGVSTSYLDSTEVFETSPATASPWDLAEITEAGLELVS